ncbi:MAG: hypothetical protein AAF718_02090 [Pseudomonadota bacterium]
MKRFFLLTAGRTGSTAVLDSLNKLPSVVALQEPFLKGRDPKEGLKTAQGSVPFFENHLNSQGMLSRGLSKLSERSHVESYLKIIEAKSTTRSTKAFGFKALRHHFKDHRTLSNILLKRAYHCICLKRDAIRQSISLQVARQRGLYNTTKDLKDTVPVHIDMNELQKSVENETQRVALDVDEFKARGFPLILVDYETFSDDPRKFFYEIQDLLDLPRDLPPASDYKRVIKNLKDTISNYDEVQAFAVERGQSL